MGLDVTGSARDPVDEAAIRLAFLGVPWQYSYHGYAHGKCNSLFRLEFHQWSWITADGGTPARVLRSLSLSHSPCMSALSKNKSRYRPRCASFDSR
jgi:hypothetical protein